MHAVVRNYSGQGASKLFDVIEERKAEVENLLREVTGFVSYTCARSEDGGVTVTVCEDKAGTDQSLQMAKDWIVKNAGDTGASAPQITQGTVIIHSR